MKAWPLSWLCVALACAQLPGPNPGDPNDPNLVPSVENCDSGVDDDRDGLVDCADPDCAVDPGCTLILDEDCANGADDDQDGASDCDDADCADDFVCAEPADLPIYSSVSVAGDFSNWDPAAPGFALVYQGEGLWRGEVTLPAGFHELKFTAEGDWAVNWGGGQDDLLPPESGAGVQDGANITLELPLGGSYDVTLNEQTGAWSLAFAEGFADGLPPVGVAFFDLLAQVEDAPAATAQQLAGQFSNSFAEAELPLVRGGEVLFLLTRNMRSGLSVAGSFNNWEAGQRPFVPVAGGVGFAGVSVGTHQRHAYKFTDSGAIWFKDQQAYEIEWDGFNPNGVGDFNSVFYTEGFAPVSRLRWLPEVSSAALGNSREVYVALPPGYDQEPTRHFPTLYVHDGNESIVRSQMDQVVRDQILAGQVAPLIAVFIALPSQDQRFNEYTFGTAGSRGDLYKSFVADELVPLIDAQFRTIDSPEARGVMGASLGGLISFHIGYDRADVFGKVGGQSSSFFWNNAEIIGRIQSGPVKSLRVYLDAGNPDGTCSGDNCQVTRRMKQVLDAKGYANRHVEQLGAVHDWFFWNQRLPGALQFLFPAGSF